MGDDRLDIVELRLPPEHAADETRVRDHFDWIARATRPFANGKV
jgi:hypothetical protein